MLLVISPAKTLDFESPANISSFTVPELLTHSQELIKGLRKLTVSDLENLMDVSKKIAELNVARYREFTVPFTPQNAKQALLAFKGDVYSTIDTAHYKQADYAFAQEHVRILSGLYGVLKPLDLMQPYRLEMGTKFANKQGKDLYAFWGEVVTEKVNEALQVQKDDVLVNLASEEYFKAVRPKKLQGHILHITFKEHKNGAYKVIGLMAKKARGMMTDFVIKKRITHPEKLKEFNVGGYRFQPALSSAEEMVFTR